MKALTLRQPWATLVALGAKRIETRGWATHHRGPLAIHAGLSLASLGLAQQPPFQQALDGEDLPRGVIVAVVELVDCILITTEETIPAEPERSFGDYHPGRYAWHLASLIRLPLPPVPARGRLGLWACSDVVEAAVVRAMEQAKG
jgi:hypothetical protein